MVHLTSGAALSSLSSRQRGLDLQLGQPATRQDEHYDVGISVKRLETLECELLVASINRCR